MFLLQTLYLLLHANYREWYSFDWQDYSSRYPDVRNSNLLPAYHFFRYGKNEGRTLRKKLRLKDLSKKAGLNMSRCGISYVVLAYNSSDYISDCIHSIQMQLTHEDELIVIDDGSTDDTVKKLKQLLNSINNSKLVQHKTNKGLLEAHRSAVLASEREYITFIDGDDEIFPYYGNVSKNILLKEFPDFVCFRWVRIPPNNIIEPRSITYEIIGNDQIETHFRNESSLSIHIGLNRKIFKKNILKQVFSRELPNVIFWEDLCVQTVVNKIAKKVVLTNCETYVWYNRENSVSTRSLSDNWFIDTEKTFSFISSIIADKNCFVRLAKAALQDGLDRLSTSTGLLQAEFFVKRISKMFYLENKEDRFWLRSHIAEALCRTSNNSSKLDGILLVDHCDFRVLENEFLEQLRTFFKGTVSIDTIQINADDDINFFIERIVKAQKHRLIVTSCGWWGPDFSTNRPTIQLWHGVGALKKAPRMVLPIISRPIWAICSAEGIKDIYAELFNVPVSQIFSLGGIIANKIAKSESSKQSDINPRKNKKILYCPTFRLIGDKYVTPAYLDLNSIEESMDEDEVLVIRLHQNIKQQYDCRLFRKIKFSTAEDITYDLDDCDAFITDYSSSVFYACLMDIPVFFWVPDLEEYKIGNRGVLLNFSKDMPGPVITSTDFHEVLEAIRKPEGNKAISALEFKDRFLSGVNPKNTSVIVEKIQLTYQLFEN